jgi:hypothetical protein
MICSGGTKCLRILVNGNPTQCRVHPVALNTQTCNNGARHHSCSHHLTTQAAPYRSTVVTPNFFTSETQITAATIAFSARARYSSLCALHRIGLSALVTCLTSWSGKPSQRLTWLSRGSIHGSLQNDRPMSR